MEKIMRHELKRPGRGKKIDAEVRKAHISAWRASGLSLSAYCRERDVAVSTLSTWIQAERGEKGSQRFHRLTVIPEAEHNAMTAGMTEIQVKGQITLRLRDAEVGAIIRIAKELAQCN